MTYVAKPIVVLAGKTYLVAITSLSNAMDALRGKLNDFHQSHLLDYLDDLNQHESEALQRDLESIPYGEMKEIFIKTTGVNVATETGSSSHERSIDDKMEPIDDDLYASVDRSSTDELKHFQDVALNAIADNAVGVLLLAGGQGTRLGVPYPKGMYKIGLPSNKTLYQVQVERVLRLEQLAKDRTGKSARIMMYVMTSEHTMGPTVDFFKQHNYFGMNPDNLVFFEQRMIPCFQEDGKIILQDKYKVARAPDGNGGLYWALKHEGTLDHMLKRGIKYVHVYCVDNVLVKVADPLFMGYCITKGAEAGNKVCEKELPTEAVGVVCKVDGKFQVVEYSEIGEETASKRRPDNRLLYNAGNICNHFFTTDFLSKVCMDHDHELPYHIAKKKIPTVGGTKISGIKLEKFVFDVFQFTDKFVVWGCLREEEFSPLKNADEPGKKDTPTTAKKALSDLHKKYVTRAGGQVLESVEELEISPLVTYAGENIESNVAGQVFKQTTVIIDN